MESLQPNSMNRRLYGGSAAVFFTALMLTMAAALPSVAFWGSYGSLDQSDEAVTSLESPTNTENCNFYIKVLNSGEPYALAALCNGHRLDTSTWKNLSNGKENLAAIIAQIKKLAQEANKMASGAHIRNDTGKIIGEWFSLVNDVIIKLDETSIVEIYERTPVDLKGLNQGSGGGGGG